MNDENNKKPDMTLINGPLLLVFSPFIAILNGFIPLGLFLVTGLWWVLKDDNKLVDYTGRTIINSQIIFSIIYLILLISNFFSISTGMIILYILWFISSAIHAKKYIDKEYTWKSPISLPFLKYNEWDGSEDEEDE